MIKRFMKFKKESPEYIVYQDLLCDMGDFEPVGIARVHEDKKGLTIIIEDESEEWIDDMPPHVTKYFLRKPSCKIKTE